MMLRKASVRALGIADVGAMAFRIVPCAKEHFKSMLDACSEQPPAAELIRFIFVVTSSTVDDVSRHLLLPSKLNRDAQQRPNGFCPHTMRIHQLFLLAISAALRPQRAESGLVSKELCFHAAVQPLFKT